MGFSVSDEEVSKRITGKDTIRKVRELQAVLKVTVDNIFVVDEATILAISKKLVDRGFTSTNYSVDITDRVGLANGAIKKR